LKNKILITGYPHTGTSILKSKFGECHDTFEEIVECDFAHQRIIDSSGNKKFIVLKSPVLPLEIRKHKLEFNANYENSFYYNYQIVLVNRNPWNLFTSIIKRGFNPLSKCTDHFKNAYYHTIEEYLIFCEIFLDGIKNNYRNIHTIRYEDFFDNDGKAIKDIMNNIGLEYNDDIFKVKTKNYSIDYRVDIPSEKPTDLTFNERYRNWQINQPFQNMNSEVDIPDELDKILKESPIIKELGYSDPRITH